MNDDDIWNVENTLQELATAVLRLQFPLLHWVGAATKTALWNWRCDELHAGDGFMFAFLIPIFVFIFTRKAIYLEQSGIRCSLA